MRITSDSDIFSIAQHAFNSSMSVSDILALFTVVLGESVGLPIFLPSTKITP